MKKVQMNQQTKNYRFSRISKKQRLFQFANNNV